MNKDAFQNPHPFSFPIWVLGQKVRSAAYLTRDKTQLPRDVWDRTYRFHSKSKHVFVFE
jgi:hypothetical protein